jgi:hypothetical protein
MNEALRGQLMQLEEHDQALRKFWFEFGSRREMAQRLAVKTRQLLLASPCVY